MYLCYYECRILIFNKASSYMVSMWLGRKWYKLLCQSLNSPSPTSYSQWKLYGKGEKINSLEILYISLEGKSRYFLEGKWEEQCDSTRDWVGKIPKHRPAPNTNNDYDFCQESTWISQLSVEMLLKIILNIFFFFFFSSTADYRCLGNNLWSVCEQLF